MGSRGRPCLTAIRSSPPIPISRRAAGNGREQSVAVQRGAVEELEPDLWPSEEARGRGGGASPGQGNDSLWGGGRAREGRIMEG